MKNARVCFRFCLLCSVGTPEKKFQIGGSKCDEWNQGVYLRFLICENQFFADLFERRSNFVKTVNTI